jgi:hypothetical protein
MIGSEILFPVLANILLVIIMFFVLGARKGAAVKAGLVSRDNTALDNKAWNDDVVKVSNNIANQFETPVLFYLLCLGAVVGGVSDTLLIVLAWFYTMLRYFHAYVHVTSNYVPLRMKVFIISLIVILIMLGLIAARLSLKLIAV